MSRVTSLLSACLRLFREDTRSFIYSFLTTPFTQVELKPYNPQIQIHASRIARQIRSLSPGVSVHFFGSSALKIAGRGDIDLVVTCSPRSLSRLSSVFIAEFGPPQHQADRLLKWVFMRRTFPVELVLTDNKSAEFLAQRRIFNILKNNPGILKQYAAIKNNLDHLTHWEYELRRKDFFNQVLKHAL